MKKRGVKRSRAILLTVIAVVFVVFVLLPLTLTIFNGKKVGNVALISIDGPITGNGNSYLGQSTTSSQDIVYFIQEADANKQVEVILLNINSPGGSAVASDEIAVAIKATEKPTAALIREAGASGGYWIASATDYIIANRMSITGSIGVISSYMEFSGLMEKYGVGYERFVAGEKKDLGTPFRQSTKEERTILQGKMDKIHQFFIEEVAQNRQLPEAKVKELATGEFFLGVEALELNLIDEVGNAQDMEAYLKEVYDLETINYIVYEQQPGLFDLLSSVFSDFFFSTGQGIGAMFIQNNNNNNFMLM